MGKVNFNTISIIAVSGLPWNFDGQNVLRTIVTLELVASTVFNFISEYCTVEEQERSLNDGVIATIPKGV